MSIEYDPLGLDELSREAAEKSMHEAKTHRQHVRSLMVEWVEEWLPYQTGTLIEERYGLERTEHTADVMTPLRPTLEDNWQRALGHLGATFTFDVPQDERTEVYLDGMNGNKFWGWEVDKYLVPNSDKILFNSGTGTFSVDFDAEFKPWGLQIEQMCVQMNEDGKAILDTHADTEDDLNLQYDRHGRLWPRAQKLLAEPRNGNVYLSRVNSHHPLLVKGLDFDKTALPQDEDDIILTIQSGIDRVRKRLLDPRLSTIASVAIKYSPGGTDTGISETVHIPNPSLPIMEYAPARHVVAVQSFIDSLKEPKGMKKLLFGESPKTLELLGIYERGLSSGDKSDALRSLRDTARSLADKEMFPVTDAWLQRNTERGAYLLDLIDAR